MYSPNSNKDLKTLDRKIDINNIFTQNRLSLDDAVEGGPINQVENMFSREKKVEKIYLKEVWRQS